MMMKLKIKYIWNEIIIRINKIRWFFERGRKGYCNADLWEIDHWMTRIMPRMLREFKVDLHSWPHNDEFKTFGEWQDCIERMAICCERSEEDYWIDRLPDDYTTEEFKECYDNASKHWEMFCDMLKKYGLHLWD